MECVTVSTHVVLTQKRYNRKNSDYNLDMWMEVKKRWLMFAILFAITLAVLAPRVGAPGGPLYIEYLRYLPQMYIYYNAGVRTRLSASVDKHPSDSHANLGVLCALSALHTHVVAPALCVVTVAAFQDIVDHRIIKGALLSSVGGPCTWLPLALSSDALSATAALATNSLVGILAVPVAMLLICGRATIPPLGGMLTTLLTTLPPFGAGLLLASNSPYSASIAPQPQQLAALVLVYAECSYSLVEAEGSLYVGDVLSALMMETCFAFACLSACYSYRSCGLVSHEHALTLAMCAIPKQHAQGWESSSACSISGLSRLPSVLRAPATALLLAALCAQQPPQ